MPKLHENIKKYRKAAGITQEELAQKVGYKSKATINKIEQGQREVPQNKIIEFANALCIKPETLMGWHTEENPDNTTQTLLNKYHSLSAEDQYAVRVMIESLAAKENLTNKKD